MRSATRLGRSLFAAVALAGGLLASLASTADATRNQLEMFQDDSHLFAAPAQTLQLMRQLGVGVVRVTVYWYQTAPRTRPRGFKATDPASYPAGLWSMYDEIVRGAQADGITVDLVLSGGAPLWATGRGQPRPGGYGEWKPSAAAYGAWVQAVGTRYSGTFNPALGKIAPGDPADLPRVSFWEPWNEPNFGQQLAPQATNGSRVLSAAAAYRSLLDAAWKGLRASGHRRDTVVIGNLDARGASAKPRRGAPQGLPGIFGATKPLLFVQALYCVSASYRELRGGSAAALGCPPRAAGSRRFRAAHPALFSASGLGVHPYPVNRPPTQLSDNDPDFTEFAQLPKFAGALDRLQRIYGSHRRVALYNTEYGYITNPPNHSLTLEGGRFVSPATGAYYMNWAEYLSWRSSRIVSTMQYLLSDPNPLGAPEFGGFASGLTFYGGAHKPAYGAYRLPLFLPATTERRGRSLEVWGCVRPAHYASIDNHGGAQRVQIQFQRRSQGSFKPLRTVTVGSARGYFDVRVRFPGRGSVRLAWSYPPNDPLLTPSLLSRGQADTIYSRTVRITVK
jgi:hypothetical protein